MIPLLYRLSYPALFDSLIKEELNQLFLKSLAATLLET